VFLVVISGKYQKYFLMGSAILIIGVLVWGVFHLNEDSNKRFIDIENIEYSAQVNNELTIKIAAIARERSLIILRMLHEQDVFIKNELQLQFYAEGQAMSEAVIKFNLLPHTSTVEVLFSHLVVNMNVTTPLACEVVGYLMDEEDNKVERLLFETLLPHQDKMIKLISNLDTELHKEAELQHLGFQKEIKTNQRLVKHLILLLCAVFLFYIFLIQRSFSHRERAFNEQKDIAASTKFAMNQHSLVSVSDLEGKIVSVNKKFVDVSGYSEEELIGQNHNILNSGHQSPAYWGEMYKKVVLGKVWHDEVRNVKKEGLFYWVDTTIVGNYLDKNLIGYTSISTETTIQKEYSELLIEANRKAEIANVSKSNFLANMSHEIRTPMNGVIGISNLLLDTELNAEQYKLAKTVKTSGEGLLSIINDILDFSKVDAGKLELEYVDFNIGSLLDDVAATMIYQIEEKGLQFICQTGLVCNQWVKSDPGRIRQVLTNIIGNAIKFTEEGEVAIHLKMDDKTDNKCQFYFEVKDTGIGLTQEQQIHLFSKFTQADSSTTRKYGGTGLGLSICKKLVELMGGKIGVRSEMGKGTTFWFSLELSLVDPIAGVALGTDDKAESLKSFNAHVLVVEDNKTNQLVIAGMLKKYGLTLDLAENGEEAIRALKLNFNYDLVFMDCQMPIMDGYAATRHIRAAKEAQLNSNVPIVAMTANAMQGDKEKCLAAGMDSYLSKPLDPIKLVNMLANWLEFSETLSENDLPELEENTKLDEQEDEGASIFDFEAMSERLMDDMELMQAISIAFADDVINQIQELKENLEANDAAEAAKSAHKIKGASANVGGMALSALALEVESACKAGDVTSVKNKMEGIEYAFETLITKMQERLA